MPKAGFAGEEHLHHQGGASGYRTREWVAHPASSEQVQLNQAFAWNPSITGTKTEETSIALADRVEIITTTPDWPRYALKSKKFVCSAGRFVTMTRQVLTRCLNGKL